MFVYVFELCMFTSMLNPRFKKAAYAEPMFEPRLMARARVNELTAEGYTPVAGSARPAPAPQSPARGRMARIGDAAEEEEEQEYAIEEDTAE